MTHAEEHLPTNDLICLGIAAAFFILSVRHLAFNAAVSFTVPAIINEPGISYRLKEA